MEKNEANAVCHSQTPLTQKWCISFWLYFLLFILYQLFLLIVIMLHKFL